MKKLFLTMFAVLVVAAASAQINKGAWLLGASSSMGFSNTTPDTGASTSIFIIDLKAGYFFVENLTFGVRLDYAKFSGAGDFSTTQVGAFARYYFNGKIFAGAGFTSVSTSIGSGSSTSTTNIPLEVGYAAFITNNIAIEPALNYIKGDRVGTFGINLGFTLYLNRTTE